MEPDILKVLAIDDNQDNLITLKAVMRDALPGCAVVSAGGGLEGIRLALAEDPDVILLDIVMPGMDGFEACRRLKADERSASIPVVFLTALRAGRESRVKALESGAEGFLSKPLDDQELVAQVRAMAKLKAANRRQQLEKERLESAVAERTCELQQELSERKRADERIAEQARILGLVPDAIILWDLDDAISYWNQGAENLYGWMAAEAIGRRIGDLFPGHARSLAEAREALLRLGEWSGELSFVTKDGRNITVQSHWALARNPDQSQAILSINTDITEKKSTENQLLHSQRLESVGRLASGIAHDLNNILAPMLIVPTMLREVIQDPGALRMVDMVETSAKRGADIIKQLLIFGRRKEGQRIPVQLRSLVKDMAVIIAETFPKNIQARQETVRDPWLVTGDPTQVHQILLNLCINARDAMPEGGTLTIKLENQELDELFESLPPGTEPGRYVCLSVADTGQGIAPEHLKKIYDPFLTTKEPGKGTGLGLSTVLGIVKSHGGFIHVQSQPGRGTKFQVFLPASELAETEPADQVKRPLPQGSGELILVVDDEENVRKVTRRILERSGYRTIEAENGVEGVSQYMAHRQDVRVVLTDIAMPAMDGVTFTRALRELNPQVLVISASGHESKAHLPADLKLPQGTHLSKPFGVAVLLETLERVLHPAIAQP